jgi:hypothetical protein
MMAVYFFFALNLHFFTWYYPLFHTFLKMKTSNKYSLNNESIYQFHKFQENALVLQSVFGHFLFYLFLGVLTKLW